MGLYGNEALKGLEGLGIVNEVRIYQDDNITITVDGDGEKYRGFEKDPYIKIYVGGSPGKKGVKLVRVAIKDSDPRYIIHNNNNDNEQLSTKERKEINKIMDKNGVGNFKDLTVWNGIEKEINRIIANNNHNAEYQKFDKPDFRNIK